MNEIRDKDMADAQPGSSSQPPVLEVEQLFKGRREIRLFYRRQEYRLRITRNQKLILTK